MNCPNCLSNVKPGARFCPYCAYDLSLGTRRHVGQHTEAPALQSSCAKCGSAITPTTRFCVNCAAPTNAAVFVTDVSPADSMNYAGYNVPAPGSRNRTAIITLAIVVALMIGGAILAFLLLKGGADGPGDVVKKIIKATERGNTEEVISYLSKRERDAINARLNSQQGAGRKVMEEQMARSASEAKQKGGLSSINIKSEKIEGDKATVEFEVKMGNGEATTSKMSLVKEDGEWKGQITNS